MPEPLRITSRDNPWLVKLRKLAHDPGAYRKLATVWVEGEHLCAAAAERGVRPVHAFVAESAWDDATLRALAHAAQRVAVLPDALFKTLSTLGSPGRLGYALELPAAAQLLPGVRTVVLDRVQDPGNVGSILRSAAALGVVQVLALEGTAALWAPKVVRAGMGSHFALRLGEGLHLEALQALQVPLVATSSHAAMPLREAAVPTPCAWVFGHEGQGLRPDLAARCQVTVRIPQPGGQESLNVAAAAAICLYESSLLPPGSGMG